MRKGEVWWADLPEPDGRRPVVLISRSASYEVRSAVTVAALTRTIRDIPSEVALGKSDGLPEKCVINADVLLTIPNSLLAFRVCTLTPLKITELDAAIRYALDL